MQQDNEVLGAPIGCIDPQYWFGGRTSSAKKIDFEKILSWFWGVKKKIFFDFLKNDAILRGMVNIGFLNAFQAPKGRSPAKYHIPGHYIKNYWFLKNRIVREFSRLFSIMADLISGRDRPEMAGSTQDFQKCVLETL